ncbi:hypothetical protein ACYFX5_15040 [Bremerella sp. T1]|uniref:hypothetical protein n=1 Tax=Bremerella sp. TYQ1 TaxID=3119568 RepID=UPI001CCE1926|nr:hypothetical protein [Bremerella volcania]UBM34371.1 hypothetical protein LA756_16990 [Bremerella volcania]
MLPIVPFLAIVLSEGGNVSADTHSGGFSANIELVYLMIIGGPFVAIGSCVMVAAAFAWGFSALRARKPNEQSNQDA